MARAFVSGDLDVDGDLTDGLRRFLAASARVSPARWAPAARARGRGGGQPQDPPLAPACAAGLRAAGRTAGGTAATAMRP